MKSRNFNSTLVKFTSHATADTQFSVAHGLGQVPAGVFAVRQSKEGILYRDATTTPTMDISSNFIAGWEFEDNAALGADSGSNALTLTNTGATQVAGKVGNASAYLLTSSQYMTRASESLLQTGDIDFTFAAWVYFTTKATYQILIGKDASSGTTPPREYAIYYDSVLDRLRVNIFSSAVAQIVQSADTFGAVPTGTWLFVVAWHDATANTLNIQVNNGGVNSNSYGATAIGGTTAAAFDLGRRSTAGSPLYLNGRLDQVMFWKRVLTSTERTFLYNSGSGRTVANSLVAPVTTLVPWTATTAYLKCSTPTTEFYGYFFT